MKVLIAKIKPRRLATATLPIVLLVICGACSMRVPGSADTSDSIPEFHADNDIAMVVSSVNDTFRDNEPLDSTEYNFTAVLTDGEGHPLYTDIQGNPGEWEVKTLGDSAVEIRNLFLGDLLPDDLQVYLAAQFELSSDDLATVESPETIDSPESVTYDLGDIYLKVETRVAVAPNGQEGPLMYILAYRAK